MNETENHQLYQEIFSPDWIERWKSWKGDGNTPPSVQEGCDHPLAKAAEKRHPNWSGGWVVSMGYETVWMPGHPRATKRPYVGVHILTVEAVLGRFLPSTARVHHVNENRRDNRNRNLAVLENVGQHNLIHRRLRALQACGNPEWLRCRICLEYDDPNNQKVRLTQSGETVSVHMECQRRYAMDRYNRKKLQLPAQGV